MHRPHDSYLLINASALPLPPRETRVNLRGTLQQVHGTPETKQNRKGKKADDALHRSHDLNKPQNADFGAFRCPNRSKVAHRGADSVTCSRMLLRMIHHMLRLPVIVGSGSEKSYIWTHLGRAIG